MKAAIYTKYGPPEVLEIRNIDKPTPKPDEVLIRIKAATVTAGDCELRRFDLPWWIWLPVRLYMGFFKPRIRVLGQEFSGEIEEVGKNVTQFSPGDALVVVPGMQMGGYAKYSCLKEDRVMIHKPSNISFEQAATLPTGGVNALHFLGKIEWKPNMKVLIIGAGGSIGTYGLQFAKMKDAEITVVDSGAKLEMLKSIGAKTVIDYKEENFLDTEDQYDVIFDVVGKSSLLKGLKRVKEGGVYLLANPGVRKMFIASWTNFRKKKKVIYSLAGETRKDLEYLANLMEEGKLNPVIDRTYTLDQIREAHHYVESGEKAGNVIIKIDS